MKLPYAIGSVPSLSGHAIAYRWRSLPRVRRHRASKPQGSSKRVLPWQVTMDQLICASLSHTDYWYEVGILKVAIYGVLLFSTRYQYIFIFRLLDDCAENTGVCVCVCVSCHPVYSVRQTCGRTSRGHTGRSHRISPPFFCGACLNFYREKDSAVPFPRRS